MRQTLTGGWKQPIFQSTRELDVEFSFKAAEEGQQLKLRDNNNFQDENASQCSYIRE